METKNDVRIQALEDQLNDWEIIRRLSNAINKTFTEKEISEIYKFYNSQTGKKLVLSQNIIDENIKDNFIDIFEEINTIRQDNENSQSRQTTYLMNVFQETHDKPDGFYLVSEKRLNDHETEVEISKKAAFEPKDIEDVKSSYNDLGNLIIDIKFKENAKLRLQEITANNINKGMAIIIDKKIITMPIIYSEIADGKLQISGIFSVEEIKNIVSKLKK